MKDLTRFISEQLPYLVLYSVAFIGALRMRERYRISANLVMLGAGLMLACTVGAHVVFSVVNSMPQGTTHEFPRFAEVALGLIHGVRFIALALLLAALFVNRESVQEDAGPPRKMILGGVGALLLLLLYALIPVAAGHGVATTGILLVLGDANEWIVGQKWGWLGVAIVLYSLVLRDRKVFLSVLLLGSLCLFASIFSFAIVSDAPLVSFGVAIPFCLGVAVAGVKCFKLLSAGKRQGLSIEPKS